MVLESTKKVCLKALTLAKPEVIYNPMFVKVLKILLGVDGFVLRKYEGNQDKATEQNLETLLAFHNGAFKIMQR